MRQKGLLKLVIEPGDHRDRATVERVGESALIYLTLNGGARRGDRLTQTERTVGEISLIFDFDQAGIPKGIEVIAPGAALSKELPDFVSEAVPLGSQVTLAVPVGLPLAIHVSEDVVGILFGAEEIGTEARWLRLSPNAYAQEAAGELRAYFVRLK